MFKGFLHGQVFTIGCVSPATPLPAPPFQPPPGPAAATASQRASNDGDTYCLLMRWSRFVVRLLRPFPAVWSNTLFCSAISPGLDSLFDLLTAPSTSRGRGRGLQRGQRPPRGSRGGYRNAGGRPTGVATNSWAQYDVDADAAPVRLPSPPSVLHPRPLTNLKRGPPSEAAADGTPTKKRAEDT